MNKTNFAFYLMQLILQRLNFYTVKAVPNGEERL
jgi:hypothetical protein